MIMAYKPISNKVVIENAIDSFNKQLEAEQQALKEQQMEADRALRESEGFISRGMNYEAIRQRRVSFYESVSHALLSECIYRVYRDAMRPELLQEANIPSMMRAMVGEFINEDYSDILFKMRTKTPVLSEMYNLITETKNKIHESINDNDPDTFRIDTSIKDGFFEKLDQMDTESISDAIRNRVTDAIDDFMVSNREDHDKIMGALELTRDKLEQVKDEPEEVRESYENISKRYISKIRNRKKGVFESMVSAMCESVMKDETLKQQFTEGAKLNVPKIVDRIETMYTFIETVNTMKLYDVNEEYMENLIQSLRK